MGKVVRDQALHTQLLFYKSLFDVAWATDKVEADNKRRPVPIEPTTPPPDAGKTMQRLKEQVERQLEASAYHTVDLSRLFAACGACA